MAARRWLPGGYGPAGEAPFPDVILLDLNLPKVDGPQLLSEFRKHPECANTPVIVVTSSDARTDRDRMAELGITSYFRKPSDLDAFLKLGSVVKEIVEERSPERLPRARGHKTKLIRWASP